MDDVYGLVACQELHERLLQFGMVHAAIESDVDLGEEALVKHALFAIVDCFVKLVAVLGD